MCVFWIPEEDGVRLEVFLDLYDDPLCVEYNDINREFHAKGVDPPSSFEVNTMRTVASDEAAVFFFQ